MKMIKLTSAMSGEPIYISVEHIVTMRKSFVKKKDTVSSEEYQEDCVDILLSNGYEEVKEDLPTILSKL